MCPKSGRGRGASPPNLEMGGFHYQDMSEPLKQSRSALPPAKYFGDIDPQALPDHHDRDCVGAL